jgi:hypothetical protein
MARGGKRAGAGRKPGIITRLTREIAEKALASKVTPLEVLLGVMREAWEAGDKALAASYAKDAAPYCHAKLAAVAHSGKVVSEVTKMTEDELADIVRRANLVGRFGSTNGASEPPNGAPVH